LQSTGLARLLPLPESRSARVAVENLARCLNANKLDDLVLVLFLHGPAGTGKTCLVNALLEEVGPEVCLCSANAFPLPWDQDDTTAAERYEQARRCDLLIVEDLQHLPARANACLISLMDERLRRRLPTVFTATTGPAKLGHRGRPLPLRLTNRLAGGLVVALSPLQTDSRRFFLTEMARHRGLSVDDEVLDWLAKILTGGGRQLEGALNQLDALQGVTAKRLTLDEVRAHFQTQAEAGQPTIDRIVHRVSAYFSVEPRLLRSARRQRRLLIARHVSMYLARTLTRMSLQQIGACFGGRDHSTVLHACRKVEQAMKSDDAVSGAVRQIRAELA
jgi:chromosomal replication initiator protein